MKNDNYNGWKNYQTWNVALWINNDESLYRLLVEYSRRCKVKGVKPTYGGLIHGRSGLWDKKTSDGVSYTDHRIARKELNRDLFEGLG